MHRVSRPRNEKGPAPAQTRASPAELPLTAKKSAAALATALRRQAQYSSKPSDRAAGARRAVGAAIAALDVLPEAERAALAAPLAAALAVVERAEIEMAPKAAADLAGVAPGTVRSWCAAGRLGRRVGGRWRVSLGELKALISGAQP